MTRKEKLNAELKRLKDDFAAMVVNHIKAFPNQSYTEIGYKLGLNPTQVARIAKEHGCSRPRGSGSPAAKKVSHEQ
jgi:hypothetical protein